MIPMEEGAEFAAADREAILSPGILQVCLLQQLFLFPVIILKRVIQHLAFEEKHAATSCSQTLTLKNTEYRGAVLVHHVIDIWSNKI
jgi:hypothetical protein